MLLTLGQLLYLLAHVSTLINVTQDLSKNLSLKHHHNPLQTCVMS